MTVKMIYCPYQDSTRDIRSNIPLRLQEFPWALPLGTPSGEGVYLTAYPSPCPNMDTACSVQCLVQFDTDSYRYLLTQCLSSRNPLLGIALQSSSVPTLADQAVPLFQGLDPLHQGVSQHSEVLFQLSKTFFKAKMLFLRKCTWQNQKTCSGLYIGKYIHIEFD